jgi:hypothetical protein
VDRGLGVERDRDDGHGDPPGPVASGKEDAELAAADDAPTTCAATARL